MEPLLSDVQMGFRKGRRCTDAIFALRQLSEKAIEYNRELNLVFVDQEKAFDRVNRDKLWRVLQTYNVKGQHQSHLRKQHELSQRTKWSHRLIPNHIWSEIRVCPITTAVHCIHRQVNKGGKPRTRSLT